MIKLHSTASLKSPNKGSYFNPGMLVKDILHFCILMHHYISGNKRATGFITFKFMTQHPNFIDGEAYKALVDILGDQIKDHSVQRYVCLPFSFCQGC